MSPEGTGWCHCHYKAPLNYLWKVIATRRHSWRLDERKHYSCLQEGQKESSGQIDVGQSYLCPWEGDGENPPGKYPGREWRKKQDSLSSVQWQDKKCMLNHTKFYLNISKHFFFTLRVVKHCNRLPREVMKLHLWRWSKPNLTWLHPEGSGQWLNVQMEISDKWCPSGVHIGTSTV